jgi:hypothetical protein
MKKWLRTQPAQPSAIAELQALIDIFIEEYNHRRPHRSLPHRATPATLYDSMPKALPGPTTETLHTGDLPNRTGPVSVEDRTSSARRPAWNRATRKYS